MTAPLLLTGGTGTLGRLVTPLLLAAGCHVRVLSRTRHRSGDGIEYVTGDLTTGDGLDAAVDGVETIMHCGGTAKGDDDKTRTLVRAASGAGVRHLAYISVVGAERVPVVSGIDRAMFGYFAAKRAAERVVTGSGIPWTILRATQFHESMLAVLRPMAKMPVVPVAAGVRFQPIDGAEVATRLVELTLGAPAGLVPDMAGPRAYPMADLVRRYLRANDRHRLILPVRFPGKAAAAIRGGANLALDHAVGRLTWDDFLAAHPTGSRPAGVSR